MNEEVKYAGFWARTGATIIDTLWMAVALGLLLFMTVGNAQEPSMAAVLIQTVIPFIVVMAFWSLKQATPGKMLFGMRIVDAETLEKVPTIRLVVRYIAYIISSIPLGLGFIWVGFDKRKQGWHDKIAGTVIVRR